METYLEPSNSPSMVLLRGHPQVLPEMQWHLGPMHVIYTSQTLPSLAQMPPLEMVLDPSFDVGLPSAVPFRNEKKHSAELQVWSLWEKNQPRFSVRCV